MTKTPKSPSPDAGIGRAGAADASHAVKLKTMHRLRPADVAALLGQNGKFNDGGSLYLHVRRGRGAWVLERRDGTTRKSIGLGPCPPVTLAQARKAAADIRAKAGPRRNPSSHTIASTLKAATVDDAAKTFGDVAKEFLKMRESQYSEERLVSFRSWLKMHTAALNNRIMREIQPQEIADTLRPIWNGSVNSTGRKLRPLIETIFNAAKINPNPATLAQLTKALVSGLPEKSKAKTKSVASLPYAEVPALMIDLAKDSGDVARLLRFIVLTGVRIKEALLAQWSEINLEAKTWTIPAVRMKMTVEHVVPLSREAIDVLGPKGEGLIFRGERFGREIGQNVALRFLKTFKRVDKEGRLVGVHGFRSSMGTWAEEREPPFTPKVIHFNLAHFSKEDKNSKAYLRGDAWKKRVEMMDTWGEFATFAQKATA